MLEGLLNIDILGPGFFQFSTMKLLIQKCILRLPEMQLSLGSKMQSPHPKSWGGQMLCVPASVKVGGDVSPMSLKELRPCI